MRDELGIASELDRLLPIERSRDPKARGVRQEVPQKGREEKKPKRPHPEDVEPEKEAPAGSAEDRNSGKILDIVI
jgi:hypothetical protein